MREHRLPAPGQVWNWRALIWSWLRRLPVRELECLRLGTAILVARQTLLGAVLVFLRRAQQSSPAGAVLSTPPILEELPKVRMPILLRDADLSDAADAEAVVGLLAGYATDPDSGGGVPLSAEARQNLPGRLDAVPGRLVLLAETEGEAVGLAVAFPGFSTFAARPLLNLHDLVVHPDWQGRGWGVSCSKRSRPKPAGGAARRSPSRCWAPTPAPSGCTAVTVTSAASRSNRRRRPCSSRSGWSVDAHRRAGFAWHRSLTLAARRARQRLDPAPDAESVATPPPACRRTAIIATAATTRAPAG